MAALLIVKTKRQQLGELIAFNRSETGLSKHNLADKTRATTKDVERWERGELCPQLQEWQRMRAVFPRMNATGNPYRELFEQAAAEQRAHEQAKDDERKLESRIPTAVGTGDLDAAVRMLLEAMPGLRTLTVEVDDAGEATVTYKTREVRIFEDTGSMQVKR